jgi:hypothetical protein
LDLAEEQVLAAKVQPAPAVTAVRLAAADIGQAAVDLDAAMRVVADRWPAARATAPTST